MPVHESFKRDAGFSTDKLWRERFESLILEAEEEIRSARAYTTFPIDRLTNQLRIYEAWEKEAWERSELKLVKSVVKQPKAQRSQTASFATQPSAGGGEKW